MASRGGTSALVVIVLAALGCRSAPVAVVVPMTVERAPAASAPGAAAQGARSASSGPCTKLAWTCGELPDAYDTKTLSGTVSVVHAKSSSGRVVRATELALDVPVCDPRGEPVFSIQIDDEHARFDGKHVSVVLEQFITARSDEVHVLGIVGSSESPSAEVVEGSRQHEADAFLGSTAASVEAAAGTPELDLGGSEGEACFLFACASHRKVCFAPGTEQATWAQLLRRNSPVASVSLVTDNDMVAARKVEK